MSFERNASGISHRLGDIAAANNGRRKFSIDSFSGGLREDGQYLENLINRDGKLVPAFFPVTLSNRATKDYSLENLLYSFGPNSTDGTDTFTCTGGAAQSSQYTDLVLTGKTFTFTKSDDDPLLDLAYFSVALGAGTYLLHTDLGDASPDKKVLVILSGQNISIQATSFLSNGKYYADVTFTVSSVGTYDIGFAAVYGDASTYSLDISKLYLFDREAAIAAGCDETTLSSASFADRYKTVTAWKQIGSGNVTSHFSDGDKSLFTVGSDIFGKDCDDGLYVVAEKAIADSAGSFYRYGGKLYLTDGQRIISVGEKSVTVPIPYIPVYARSCSQDGATFTAGEPLNIFCHYAKVEFDVSSELTRIIPAELFCGGTCTVYRSGTVLMSPSTYTFTVADGVGTLTLAVQTNATLTVCVSLSSSSSEGKLSYGGFAPARLAFCSSKTPLTVGTSADGIRTAIAAGSGGLLYLMKQYGEAYVGDDFTAAYVGGEITALTPYDGGFFVLLSDSVKKLAVADGVMTISDFRGDAGCDAPKSVTQCGDMTVFAGLGGIYYICRYGITDRDESRRASLCASSALSEVGASDIIASEGIFTGEKYYLFAGDTALVWDVYAKAPQSKGSESDEKKLVWYALSLEGMRGVIGTSGGKVYYLADDGVRYFSFGDADGICPSCEFHSAVYYPEDVLTEKLLCKIEVCATLEDSATLSVYCDGIRLPDEYTLHASGENSVYKIGLPPRKFRGIAFGISGTKFKLIGLKAEYYTEV